MGWWRSWLARRSHSYSEWSWGREFEPLSPHIFFYFGFCSINQLGWVSCLSVFNWGIIKRHACHVQYSHLWSAAPPADSLAHFFCLTRDAQTSFTSCSPHAYICSFLSLQKHCRAIHSHLQIFPTTSLERQDNEMHAQTKRAQDRYPLHITPYIKINTQTHRWSLL